MTTRIYTPHFIQIVVMSLIGITICLLNTALIYIVLKGRKKSVRMNYLLISLAVSDLIFGAIAIPLHLIAEFVHLGQGKYTCLLLNSVQMPLSLMSLLFLIMMAVDRLIAITYPFTYTSLVTSRRLGIVIGLVWVYGLICTVLPMIGWNNFDIKSDLNISLKNCNFMSVMDGSYVGFFFLGHFIPGGVIMLVLYIKIFLSTRKHNRQIGNSEELNLPRDIALRLAAKRSHRTTSKLIVTLGSVFIVSFLPLSFAMILDYNAFTLRVVEVWVAPYELYLIGSFLVSLNAVINPLIVGFTKRSLRIHILKLFKKGNTVHVQVTNVSSAAGVTWKPEISRVQLPVLFGADHSLHPRD